MDKQKDGGGEMFTYLRGIGKFDEKQLQFYSKDQRN